VNFVAAGSADNMLLSTARLQITLLYLVLQTTPLVITRYYIFDEFKQTYKQLKAELFYVSVLKKTAK
jgi:hypothetical protein